MANCPVNQQTGDGVAVGRCYHHVSNDGMCPLHGRVGFELRVFDLFDHMMLESDMKTRQAASEALLEHYKSHGHSINLEGLTYQLQMAKQNRSDKLHSDALPHLNILVSHIPDQTVRSAYETLAQSILDEHAPCQEVRIGILKRIKGIFC